MTQLHFHSLKSICAGFIAIILLGQLIPIAGANHLTSEANITVSEATRSFNPELGEPATINYSVTGTETAEAVQIRIFRVSPATPPQICNPITQNLITTIDGSTDRAPGDYSATWNGHFLNNLSQGIVPDGDYCFRLRWDNQQSGSALSYGLREGIITVYTPPAPPVPGDTGDVDTGGDTGGTTDTGTGTVTGGTGDTGYGSGTGIGTGGAGTGSGSGTGSSETGSSESGPTTPCTLTQVSADISACVTPAFFDPTTNPPQFVTLYYTLGRRLNNGLTVAIRKADDTPVRTFVHVPVANAGVQTPISWNGRYNGSPTLSLPQGIYKFVFMTETSGLVGSVFFQIAYGATGTGAGGGTGGTGGTGGGTQPPVSGPFVTFSAPYSFVPSQSPATISYTLTRPVVNFRLTVQSPYGTLSKQLVSPATLGTGSYSVTWDGTFNGAPGPLGRYDFIFQANGENNVTGSIYIASPGQQTTAPVITDFGPTQSSFVIGCPPNDRTTLRYQVNQNAQVDVTIMNGPVTVRRLVVSNLALNANANILYSIVWDGRNDNGLTVAPGPYTYLIEARNSSGVAQSRTGTITVLQVIDFCGTTGMNVSNVFAEPSTFNPLTQNTLLKFTLNQNANVAITITRASDGSLVRTIPAQYFDSGGRSMSWNGADSNGVTVQDETYNFRVDATSTQGGGFDSESSTITANRGGTPGGMVVSNVFANPNPFNPEQQSTLLTFTLNQPGSVTITVTRASDGAHVRSIFTTPQFYNAGSNLTAVWNGADSNGTLVQTGTYNFRIDAVSTQFGSNFATGSVTVNRSGIGTLQITDFGPVPSTINPSLGQTTNIDFSVNMVPSSVSMRVYRGSTTGIFVRELSLISTGTNSYRAQWNGRDSNNVIVPNDNYTYRIDVTAQGQSAQRTGTIFVSSGTFSPPPPPPPGGNCGAFSDVPTNHYLCPAIEFVRTRGYFVGYPDGTLGVDKVIKRVELLAVIQKAFHYPLETYNPSADGDLGFSDLRGKTNEWYMPYIKTFLHHGLIAGYPDHTMRPERTMSTAELYLVFLKAAKEAPGNIANFDITNHVLFAPFIDTPLNASARWYIKYAAFAKLNDLVVTERFYPARGITRGQVMQLIYDTHRKGLVTYN